MGAKTLKLKVRNYSNFTITFPKIWRCAGEFFKVLLKFKMAATDQLQFFRGRNSNFNITFLATWGSAYFFLKMLPKFKIAARGQLQIFLWAQKLQNLRSENYSNFSITFPTIWRCASDFFKKILLFVSGFTKFKMAAMDKLHIFLWAQKLNVAAKSLT